MFSYPVRDPLSSSFNTAMSAPRTSGVDEVHQTFHLSHSEWLAMPKSLGKINGHVSSLALILPDKVTTLPPWINSFRMLHSLTIQDYQGEKLDMRALEVQHYPSLSVLVQGQALQEVLAPLGLPVAALGGVPDAWISEKKAVVAFYDQGKEVERKTLANHSYFAASREGVQLDNWNCKVHFPNTDAQIACRHLALDWLLLSEEEGTGKRTHTHRADQAVARWRSPDLISKNVSPDREWHYQELQTYGRDNFIVGMSQLGPFIAEQFKTLAPGRVMRIMVTTGNHAMGLLLKAKLSGDKPLYVAEWYDPNLTLTHVRRVATETAQANAWTLDDFCEQAYQDNYLGVGGNRECILGCTVVALDEKGGGTLGFPPGERTIQLYANEAESVTPLIGYHLLDRNLPLDLLWAIVDANPERAMHLLQAKDSGGQPGLIWPMYFGNKTVIQCFLEHVERLAKKGILSSPQVAQLLAAVTPKGTSGLASAMRYGHTDTVDTFLEGVTRLAQLRILDSAQVAELLAAVNHEGVSAFAFALRYGHTATAQCFLERVAQLAKMGVLSPAQVAELCAAKDQQGRPILHYCLAVGHEKAVRCLLDGVVTLAEKGVLSAEHVVALLTAFDGQSTGLQHVVCAGFVGTLACFLDAVEHLASAGILQSEQIAGLLSAQINENDPVGMQIALERGRGPVIVYFFEAIRRLAGMGKLTSTQLVKLVGIKSNDIALNAIIALKDGHENAISSFLTGVEQLAQSNILTSDQLAELLEKFESMVWPVLNDALRSGNAIGVRGFGSLLRLFPDTLGEPLLSKMLAKTDGGTRWLTHLLREGADAALPALMAFLKLLPAALWPEAIDDLLDAEKADKAPMLVNALFGMRDARWLQELDSLLRGLDPALRNKVVPKLLSATNSNGGRALFLVIQGGAPDRVSQTFAAIGSWLELIEPERQTTILNNLSSDLGLKSQWLPADVSDAIQKALNTLTQHMSSDAVLRPPALKR